MVDFILSNADSSVKARLRTDKIIAPLVKVGDLTQNDIKGNFTILEIQDLPTQTLKDYFASLQRRELNIEVLRQFAVARGLKLDAIVTHQRDAQVITIVDLPTTTTTTAAPTTTTTTAAPTTTTTTEA